MSKQDQLHILMLAPHPFFQERGTPIAVDLLLQTLSTQGHSVDVVTFAEGEDRDYPGVRIYRSWKPSWIHHISPGFSMEKLICDFFMFFKVMTIIRKQRPDIIHAVEESAFMALVYRCLYSVPYIYDMDSSLAQQMIEKNALVETATSFFQLV